MANNPNHAGWAFPASPEGFEPEWGLTVRDYFAAAVASAIAPLFDIPDYREAARRAYALADAMIAERESAKTEA